MIGFVKFIGLFVLKFTHNIAILKVEGGGLYAKHSSNI